MKSNSKKTWIILILLSVLFLTAAFAYKGYNNVSIDSVKLTIESWGKFAPFIFVLLCIGRSFALLPCGLFSVLGGMLFGPALGTAVVLFGFTIGSVITFYMARYLGSQWTERIMGERFKKVDKLVSKNGFYSVFLMRAVPILPFDVVSCIAGMSKVRLAEYVPATFIGSIPGVFVYVYFGDSIISLSPKKIIFSVAFTAAFTAAPFIYRFAAKLLKKYALRTAENNK